MNEMIEKVARAIAPKAFAVFDGYTGPRRLIDVWEVGYDEHCPAFIKWCNARVKVNRAMLHARRAIEAMREPTEAMCEAGAADTAGDPNECYPLDAHQIWSAMIASILQDTAVRT